MIVCEGRGEGFTCMTWFTFDLYPRFAHAQFRSWPVLGRLPMRWIVTAGTAQNICRIYMAGTAPAQRQGLRSALAAVYPPMKAVIRLVPVQPSHASVHMTVAT